MNLPILGRGTHPWRASAAIAFATVRSPARSITVERWPPGRVMVTRNGYASPSECLSVGSSGRSSSTERDIAPLAEAKLVTLRGRVDGSSTARLLTAPSMARVWL